MPFSLDAREIAPRQRAGHRAAAEIRGLIAHALLIAEAGDLDVKRQFAAAVAATNRVTSDRSGRRAQMFNRGKRDEDAERAVVFARVADGIEVRAEQERAGAAARAGPAAEQVEGGVFAHVEASRAHPRADQRVGARHRGRVERARQAAGLVGDRAQLVAAAHQLPR